MFFLSFTFTAKPDSKPRPKMQGENDP